MRLISFMLAAVALAAAFVPVSAADYRAGSLTIRAPWTRATPRGADVAGAYLSVTNTGTVPDRLIGGSSDVSAGFEVHSMTMDQGVMRMRPVEGGIEIRPGETVTLAPGGLHVMLLGLKRPLAKGERVKGSLVFQRAGTVEVEFSVEALGASRPGGISAGHPAQGH
jgi:copper(I)-binding protein